MKKKSYAIIIREAVRRKWHTPEQKEWWYAKLSLARRKKLMVLFKQQDGKCFFCRQECYSNVEKRGDLPRKRLATIDHKIPQKAGGTDNLRNLVMACLGCNNARGIMNFERFAEIRLDQAQYVIYCRRRVGIKGQANNEKHRKKVAKRQIRLNQRAWELAVLFWLRPDIQPVFEQLACDLNNRKNQKIQTRLDRIELYL